MPDQKATTPPDAGLIPADAGDRRGNSRGELIVTDRDRALRTIALSEPEEHLLDCSGLGWAMLVERVDQAISQGRREGREEAAQAIRYGRDYCSRHCHSDVRDGMDRALAAISALDQPAPDGAEE